MRVGFDSAGRGPRRVASSRRARRLAPRVVRCLEKNNWQRRLGCGRRPQLESSGLSVRRYHSGLALAVRVRTADRPTRLEILFGWRVRQLVVVRDRLVIKVAVMTRGSIASTDGSATRDHCPVHVPSEREQGSGLSSHSVGRPHRLHAGCTSLRSFNHAACLTRGALRHYAFPLDRSIHVSL